MSRASRFVCFMNTMRKDDSKDADECKMLALRLANGLRVLNYCDEFERRGFAEQIVDALCKEKMAFAAVLRTKGDEKEFWKGPRVYSNGNELVPSGRYHSEAEELLIWSEVMSVVPLEKQANDRIMMLFRKYFGELPLQ